MHNLSNHVNLFFFFNNLLPIIVRILGMIYIAPIFCETVINYKIKILIAFIFSIFLYPYIPINPIDSISLIGIIIIFVEFLIGFFIGITFKLIFVIVNFSSDVLSSQIGLSFVTCLDLNNNCITIIITRLIQYITFLFFLISDMHLWIISIIMHSFINIPIASLIIHKKFLPLIFFFSNVFTQGLKLFFPVLLLLFFLNILILFLSRIINSFFLFSLNFSLTWFFGIFFLYIFFSSYIYYIKILFQEILFFLLHNV